MQNSHKGGEQRTYGIRNLEECTENGRCSSDRDAETQSAGKKEGNLPLIVG
jgi:hypothetical protein